MLLTVVEATMYKLFCSLVAPAKVGEKSYSELVSVLSAHFNPVPFPIICRFKVHSRCRWPGESVAVFVSQPRSLSENCGFGESLNETVRDWIICGINNDMIQKSLLTGADLKFNKAVQLAQSMETAARNVKELQQLLSVTGAPSLASAGQEVHKVTQPVKERQSCSFY